MSAPEDFLKNKMVLDPETVRRLCPECTM